MLFNKEKVRFQKYKNWGSQCSILGPRLFLIYINDTPNAGNVFGLPIYNTILLLRRNANVQNIINQVFQHIQWLMPLASQYLILVLYNVHV